MNWGEFVEWMKAQGVKDDDEISFIDFSGEPNHVDLPVVVREDGKRYIMVD